MPDFAVSLTAEINAFREAPFILMTAIIIIAVVIWGVFKWANAQRFEDFEVRLKLRDDQIADYRDKLSGATPDEARNRIDALELQVKALAPRRLSVDQREKILSVIRPHCFSLEILHDTVAPEARSFAKDLSDTFDLAGWCVQRNQAMGVNDPPISGIRIDVFDLNKLDPAETLVITALRTADIVFELKPGRYRAVTTPIAPPSNFGMPSEQAADVSLLISFSSL